MNSRQLNKVDEVTRRQFLLNAAKSYLGVSTAPMLGASLASPAFAEATSSAGLVGKAEHVIFLNMDGGMSHIDTFDVKPGTDVQGPVKAINSAGDFQLSEFLPNIAKEADKICLISSMTSTQGAHDQAQYQLHSSYSPLATITHPSTGAWAVRMKGRINQALPGFVAIGTKPQNTTSGFMGAEYGAVRLGRADEGLKNSKMAHGVSEDAVAIDAVAMIKIAAARRVVMLSLLLLCQEFNAAGSVFRREKEFAGPPDAEALANF